MTPDNTINQDTAKMLSEGDELELLVIGRAWAIVRQRLTDKILDISDIFSLDNQDINKLAMELGARQIASEILWNWLRDIEGDAIRNKTNKELFREYKKDDLIKRV
jgi:hypothetical protein